MQKHYLIANLLVIKKSQFEEYALSEPNVLSALSNWLSTRYIKSQIKCQDLIMNGKKGGLYSILIRLCSVMGSQLKMES